MNLKRRIENERGQTMTEFAFVLPILLVLLFGIIQFGIIFNNYVSLTDAARAASRKGAVSRSARHRATRPERTSGIRGPISSSRVTRPGRSVRTSR
jgi:Flp pilus assembly protein TadG